LEKAWSMFRTIFEGLMKNDIDILNKALKGESEITQMFNDLTTFVVEISKKRPSKEEKEAVLDLVDIISYTEEIGDSCVRLIEQIEYKIRENLLISEAAVDEYKDLYSKTEQILSDTIKVMHAEGGRLAKKIIESKPNLDVLIDKYRANHIDRSANGICNEWAKIRYLEMLNITQTIVYYCIDIAGKLVKS
ncbi:MAG: PhoU domain-containing protein, partial [Candidatus Omnitrophota bacterium]